MIKVSILASSVLWKWHRFFKNSFVLTNLSKVLFEYIRQIVGMCVGDVDQKWSILQHAHQFLYTCLHAIHSVNAYKTRTMRLDRTENRCLVLSSSKNFKCQKLINAIFDIILFLHILHVYGILDTFDTISTSFNLQATLDDDVWYFFGHGVQWCTW